MQLGKRLTTTGVVAIGLLVGLLLILAAGIALAAAAPGSVTSLPIIDDFESGMPADWFSYGDYGSGSAIAPNVVATGTVPGAATDNHVLEIAYTSAGWGAGTGKNLGGQDWHLYDGLAFWFRGGNSGGVYRVILSDNPNPAVPGDSAERFAYEFTDNTAGWRYVLIPWGAFFRDPGYQPPGAPNDGLTLTEVQAYALALPSGTRTAYVDDVRLVKFQNVDDFEGGLPAGWFQYGDYGSGTAIATNVVTTATVPGAAADNHVLEIAYTSAGWGAGTGKNLPGPDWSPYSGLSFWFFGSNSGGLYRVILSDNPNPAVPGDSAERFAYEFTDNASGWRYVSIPWGAFFRDPGYQPPGAPNDGLTLTEVQAYALALPSGTRTTYLDQVALFGAGQVPLTVAFDQHDYAVKEGGTATITATLNLAATTPVTVTYTTADGTATAGTDYVAASGQLVFPPGTMTKTFTVTTLDNKVISPDLTVTLALTNPVGAALGTPNRATLSIANVDQPSPFGKVVLIDDFESGLPMGHDGNNIGVGFQTWAGGGSTVAITTTAAPAPVPGVAEPNHVLKLDANVTNWGGFTHAFTNAAADQWLSQDWSSYVGLSLWVYGNNSSTDLFVDLLENRNPGSTTDDAERWTYAFKDDFSGWKLISIPWASFQRKDIGNGAPNDGLTLREVHGWAFGTLNTNGPKTYYLDNAGLMVRTTLVDDFESGLPTGHDANNIGVGFQTWTGGGSTVAITTTAAPVPVPGIAEPNHVLKLDANVTNWGGFTHAFTNAAADQWLSQDWSSYDGIELWVFGNNSNTDLFVDLLENRNPGSTTDDAERWTYAFKDDFSGWKLIDIPFGSFQRKDIGNGAPNDGLTLREVHGWAFGTLNTNGPRAYYLDNVTIYGNKPVARPVEVQFELSNYSVNEGASLTMSVTLSTAPTQTVTVKYATTDGTARPIRDYLPISGTLTFAPGVTTRSVTLQTVEDGKYAPNKNLFLALSDPVNAVLGGRKEARVIIAESTSYDPALLDDFETYPYLWRTQGNVTLSTKEIKSGDALALPGQAAYENVLKADYGPPATQASASDTGFSHPFAQGQDWRSYNSLNFWYHGQNTGKPVTVELQDNRAPDPGPAGWQLVWSDEFNDQFGTPPNPNTWTHEVGDGKIASIPGWGNSELEYYTDSTDNAAADGQGNLVITARKVNTATTTLACYYGPCEYTSARLISANKAEFAHGRIEARIQVPYGQGLWPAFWMLGNDISRAGWPQSGEIDIMENVGKEPAIAHGTVHGPGYSGGNGIGGGYTLPTGRLADDFHVFAVEWEPGRIRWFVDNTNYFTVTTASIPTGREWVYEHPFYLLLNVAVGGGWPGNPDDTTVFPQTMKVDYVRVYQGPDTAERFATTFTDNFTGWQKVLLPFRSFTRAASQPAGAPNDGLTLSQVWGYGFDLPQGASGTVYLDQVRLVNWRTQYLPFITKRP